MAKATIEDVGAVRPVYVVGFLHFRQPLVLEQVQEIFLQRLIPIPRFSSRAVEEKGKYVWVPLPPISMADVVIERTDIKTSAGIDAFCAELYKDGLGEENQEKPLPWWRAFIFNDMEDGRSLLLFAVNHAIADGPSLIASLLAILDDQESPPKTSSRRAAKPPGCFAKLGGCCTAICKVTIGDQLPGDKPSKLKVKNHRQPGCDVVLGQSECIDLGSVKDLAKRYGGATVNDILMAVVTLTIQSYLSKHDPAVIEKKQTFHANFPISIRKAGTDALSEENFGNLFAAGNLNFPIGEKDPCKIVDNIQRQIQKIKASPEPIFRHKMTNMLASAGLKASTLWDLILDMYGKVSVMLSNIVGPAQTAYLAEQPIDQISFYALAPLGFYIGVVSYNDKISCGVALRQECEPDVTKVTSEWVPAFEKLQAAILAKTS